jgi:hypothetical protein
MYIPVTIDLSYRPRPAQQRLHALAAAHRFAVAIIHRQAGKTHAALIELITRALSAPANATLGFVMPQQKQVRGIAWPLLSRLGLGKLPGDIHIERGGFNFYFPITTGIIISLIITLILWIFRR